MRAARTIPLVFVAACGVFDPEPLPPHGETLVVVDTDLPVPSVVSRLRIDVFAEDGSWIAHRDDVRPDPRDWPASFSVFNDDETRVKTLRVRLRAYLDARTVPYRGSEKLASGITPDVEPNPLLAVDRTIELRLVHGTRSRARVLLRGDCIGLRECAADEPVVIEPALGRFERDVPSAVGTFGLQPCGEVSSEDRVCVPGGVFVLGDAFERVPTGSDLTSATAPERVFRISRFEIDRDEVTVGRLRAARGDGFAPPVPVGAVEDDVFPPADLSKACTWSEAARGREEHPLNCVSWETAAAFCRFAGGELPSEAQWEYVALAAGRARKTLFPWGDDAPACERGVYGRAPFNEECADRGQGPAALAADGDTTALGVRHLATSLEEHARDRHAAYSDRCWEDAARIDPVCAPSDTPDGDRVVTRGASWVSRSGDLRSVRRSSTSSRQSQNALLGFRCVYALP